MMSKPMKTSRRIPEARSPVRASDAVLRMSGLEFCASRRGSKELQRR